MEIPFPADVHLLAYADDIPLVATGRNLHVNAQSALNSLKATCRELGLKVNNEKLKELQLRIITGCR